MLDFHYAGPRAFYACHNCAPHRHFILFQTTAVNNGRDRVRIRTHLSESIWRNYCLLFCVQRIHEEEPYAFTFCWIRALENLCDSLPTVEVFEMANRVEWTALKISARCSSVLGVIRCYVTHLRTKEGGYEILGVIGEVLGLTGQSGSAWNEHGVDTRPEWEHKAIRDAEAERIRKEWQEKWEAEQAEYARKWAKAERLVREEEADRLREEEAQRLREESGLYEEDGVHGAYEDNGMHEEYGVYDENGMQY